MFRKPKTRNLRQRQKDDEADGKSAEIAAAPSEFAEPPVQPPPPKSTPLLSFDEPEADTNFVRRKSRAAESAERLQRHLKKRERNRVPEPPPDEEAKPTTEDVITLDEDDETNGAVGRPRKPVNLEILDEEIVVRRRKSISIGDDEPIVIDEEETRVQATTIEISDAKTVYEARKMREQMRATGAGVRPAIPLAENTASVEDRHAQRSRLVREDENDLSDEENPNFITSKDLLYNEELRRRDEQLEALHVEQGDSDDEAAAGSGDDDWEAEQIRRAVSRRKVAELKDERQTHIRSFYNQETIAPIDGDRIVDESMDIEVVPQANQASAFIDANGRLKRAQKYESMAELVEKLRIGISNRHESIRTKEHQIEQHTQYIADNRESIAKMTEANARLERNFQLFQEIRFFVSNVLNCLNEKVPEINEIETAMFELWRTRADDLARRRAESRTPRRFGHGRHSQGEWDDAAEESVLPQTFAESTARILERAATIFEDTANEYCDVGLIVRRFVDWQQTDPQSFADAFIAECLPKILGPFVRIDLLDWNPLLPPKEEHRELSSMLWYQEILRLGFNNEGIDPNDPFVVNLIPDCVEKIVLPKLTKLVAEQWDPHSSVQTERLVAQIDRFVRTFVTVGPKSRFFAKLLNAIRTRAQEALQGEREVPEHLRSIVAEIHRPQPPQSDPNDMAALMAQAKSIMK
ncbi:T-SNARE coiled-coil-like proteiny domain-containing protein [Aphelenchoides fujianensis]|nr:T-SNARE coiled-coil-like proteiny domain-containing protein [Aphelenchoides fujianensis]